MAEADISWLVRGVDTRRWHVQAGSNHTSDVGVRIAQVDIPNRHGVVVDELDTFEPVTLQLEFLLKGVMTSLKAAEVELKRALHAPGLVVALDAGGLAVSAPAKCLGLSQGEFVPDASARFTAQVLVPGGMLRGAQTDYDAGVVTSGLEVAVPAAAAGSAPVADAVVRVRGALSAVSLVDIVSGTGMSWSGTALTGADYLYLDAARATARVSTSSTAWASGGTDVSGGISFPALGLLQLWPGPSAADVAVGECSVTVTGTGFDGTTGLVFRVSPAYL